MRKRWPTKAVTIVAPFQAGGGVDLLARRIGAELQEKLHQPFVVDNRAGANGNIGAAAVAKSAPDGYTLLIATPGIAVQNKMVYKTMPFDADRDFVPIVLIAKAPQLVVVNPKLPVKTMGELVAYAKANPGKLNFGSTGVGSQGHVTLELLKKLSGIEITHVPYRTSAPVNTDIISGQIEGSINYVTVTTAPVKEGLMRALAITSKVRSRQLPDVPTLEEVGYPGFEFDRLVRRRRPARHAGRRDPKDQRHRQRLDQDREGHRRPRHARHAARWRHARADVTAWVKSENERWGPIIKAIGIKM